MSTTGLLLLSGVLRGAVILGAGLIVTSLLPRKAAAIQHVILCAALFAQVAIPLLTVFTPRGIGSVVPARVTSVVAATESPIVGAASLVDLRAPGEAAARSDSITSIRLAQIVWLAGTVAIIVWMIYGRLYMRRVGRRFRKTRTGPVFDALNSAVDDLGFHRPVTLLEGSPFSSPVTWGTVYPVILMPVDAARWTNERLRMSLLHETAHIIRRDATVQAAARIAAACVWFNPLVWLALRRVRLAAERAADDVVVNCGIEPTQYVDALVDMLKNAKPAARAIQSSFAMARRSDFETRMLAVLDDRVARSRVGVRATGSVAIAFACIAVLVAAVPAQVGPSTVVSPRSPSTSSDVSAWIKAASSARLDPQRLQLLKRAAQPGRMTPSDVDAYLDVVAGMSRAIPVSESIVALTKAASLDELRRTRALGVAVNIKATIPRSMALDALSRSIGQ